MSENESKTAAPDPAAVVDAWYRDTFVSSAVGRELSSYSHNVLIKAIADLKQRLKG